MLRKLLIVMTTAAGKQLILAAHSALKYGKKYNLKTILRFVISTLLYSLTIEQFLCTPSACVPYFAQHLYQKLLYS